MAQSKNNILVQGFSGSIARLLTFRQLAGKTYVSGFPKKRSGGSSTEQLAFKEKFLAATSYAKLAMQDPDLKAAYEAKAVAGQTAYNMAVRDAIKPPVVEAVDATAYQGQPGNAILITASDDYKVDKVTVTIHDALGALLESGEAILNAGDFKWTYLATHANVALQGSKIAATAYDLPGNTGMLELTL